MTCSIGSFDDTINESDDTYYPHSDDDLAFANDAEEDILHLLGIKVIF
jgi:hypothetical protein